MRPNVLATVAGLILGATGWAYAHHGYGTFYDPMERTVAIEGTLESLLYANPHVVLKIRTAGSTVWQITWQSPASVTRSTGVTPSTFAIGDHLIVIGAPSRNPDSREVAVVREVRRPSDGWAWRSRLPFAPP